MGTGLGIEVGISRAVITPPPGVALAGYFSPRYNRGVLDDLYAKVCIFRNGEQIGGLVQLDLIEAPLVLCAAIRRSIRDRGLGFADDLLIGAIHTHTGPEVFTPRDDRHRFALDFIADQVGAAAEAAMQRLRPAQLLAGHVINNPFAFNRRYVMKSGRVVTNPGKLNPDIVRPEGTVDREIGFVRIVQDGRLSGLVVNIVNHTDTIGGDLVSADWAGFLERRMQRKLGWQVPVVVLVGASGNINHFDVTSEQDQTSYAESRRIGQGYADIVLRSLETARPLASDEFRARHAVFSMQKRRVTPAELDRARALLAESDSGKDGEAMTSEDLARGGRAVLRHFAGNLIAFPETAAGKTVDFDIAALAFGRELAIVSLPGEPFTEIGLQIKAGSPFAQTFIVSNANGYAGYIPLSECYERGGYEVLPVLHGGAAPGTDTELVRRAREALDAAADE